MEEIVVKPFFCTKCSLQFHNSVVYNMHTSLLHQEAKNKEQPENEIVKKETEFATQNNILQYNVSSYQTRSQVIVYTSVAHKSIIMHLMISIT